VKVGYVESYKLFDKLSLEICYKKNFNTSLHYGEPNLKDELLNYLFC
jgi:hypothetical protein